MQKATELRIDLQIGSAYVRYGSRSVRGSSVRLSEDVVVHYDSGDRIAGIELIEVRPDAIRTAEEFALQNALAFPSLPQFAHDLEPEEPRPVGSHGLTGASRRWPNGAEIEFTPEADRLTDLQPLLDRIVAAVGLNATAGLLGVGPAQVSGWMSGAPISAEIGHRVLDLHAVLTRVLRLFPRDIAAQWLFGSEPRLGGARPIDVLALHGSAPVLRALDGIAQDAYS
jgi:hypothetical protein